MTQIDWTLGIIGGVFWAASAIVILGFIVIQIIHQPFGDELKSLDRNLIIQVVCHEFNVTEEQLRGRHRIKNIVEARRAICYFCYVHLQDSLSAIGQMILRDHSTVQYSVERMRELIAINDPSVVHLRKIENKFFNQTK